MYQNFRNSCLGKIIAFNETKDGRFLIELKGLSRFQKINEIESEKNID